MGELGSSRIRRELGIGTPVGLTEATAKDIGARPPAILDVLEVQELGLAEVVCDAEDLVADALSVHLIGQMPAAGVVSERKPASTR
jgi:hypothetical protein